jgi:hypothetical protein
MDRWITTDYFCYESYSVSNIGCDASKSTVHFLFDMEYLVGHSKNIDRSDEVHNPLSGWNEVDLSLEVCS